MFLTLIIINLRKYYFPRKILFIKSDQQWNILSIIKYIMILHKYIYEKLDYRIFDYK